eukprot:2529690-Amphidinium_carterae.1
MPSTPVKQPPNPLDAAWKETRTGTKDAKQVKTIALTEAVRHALDGACTWATPLEVDGIIGPEGLNISFGKTYYKHLRQQFGSHDRVESQIEALQQDDYVPGMELLAAASAALKQQPNRSSQHPPTRENKLNQMRYGDFLCVCKLFNDLEEKASTEQLHVAKSIISGCSRLSLWTQYSELACILSHKIDGVLTEAVAWCKARSGSYGPKDWLLGHRRLWEIILPVSHVDAILGAEERIVWTEHAESIDIIVKSCYLGEALFGFCLPQVLGALIEIELNKVKLEIAKCAVLDEATYVAMKNKAKAQVRTIGNISSLPERRQVKVQYRNWEVPLWVKSVEEQIDLVLHSYVRGVLCHLELIPALPGEDLLCGAPTEPGFAMEEIAAELWTDAKSARQHFHLVLKATDAQNTDLLEACWTETVD